VLRRVGVFLVLGSVVLTAGVLDAQEPGPLREAAYARHSSECRQAAEVLTTGQSANRYDWARSVITGCGELGGAALAGLIRRHRTETTDTAHFETIVTTASMLRDSQIYEAGLDVVQDRAASTFARVQAARILYHQLFPSARYGYEDFVFEPSMAAGGRLPLVSTAHLPVGRALPADAFDRAAAALAPLGADTLLPRDLHIALRKVTGAVEFELLVRRVCGKLDPDGPECVQLIDDWFEEGDGFPEPPEDDDEVEEAV
jgi:hypothetical protein